MDRARMRHLVEGAPVGRLATLAADGRLRLVPCVFVLIDGPAEVVVYTPIDHKPKQTPELIRLQDIEERRHATLLVDHYEDDWSALWWVRLRGSGRVLRDGDEHEIALDHLVSKYAPYRAQRPTGAVIAVDVVEWRGWAAQDSAGG